MTNNIPFTLAELLALQDTAMQIINNENKHGRNSLEATHKVSDNKIEVYCMYFREITLAELQHIKEFLFSQSRGFTFREIVIP